MGTQSGGGMLGLHPYTETFGTCAVYVLCVCNVVLFRVCVYYFVFCVYCSTTASGFKPICSEQQQQLVGKVVRTTRRPHFDPKEIPWYSFLSEAEWTPGLPNADTRIKPLEKFPRTPPGSEPGISRLAAPYLNRVVVSFLLKEHCDWFVGVTTCHSNNYLEVACFSCLNCGSVLATCLRTSIDSLCQDVALCLVTCVSWQPTFVHHWRWDRWVIPKRR